MKPLRVCAFESRRAIEIGRLIEKFGGLATVAPSMKEVPLESNPDPLLFLDRLLAGEIDLSIFLTGVGTDALYNAVESRITPDDLTAEIKKTFVAVRGPKPAAALAKRGIQPDLRAPEPNTWKDLAAEFLRQEVVLHGKSIAVQEYGVTNQDLRSWLESQGAEVQSVSIYCWELPDDLEPMKQAIRNLIAGDFDLILWTSAQQVVHVTQVASDMGLKEEWLRAAQDIPHCSIGPTASERLREYGFEPAMEPSHPKMAYLVREALDFVAASTK